MACYLETHLNKVIDKFGNEIIYSYKNEDNETCILYLRDDGKYGLIETE